jgi:hypothetical protein
MQEDAMNAALVCRTAVSECLAGLGPVGGSEFETLLFTTWLALFATVSWLFPGGAIRGGSDDTLP